MKHTSVQLQISYAHDVLLYQKKESFILDLWYPLYGDNPAFYQKQQQQKDIQTMCLITVANINEFLSIILREYQSINEICYACAKTYLVFEGLPVVF